MTSFIDWVSISRGRPTVAAGCERKKRAPHHLILFVRIILLVTIFITFLSRTCRALAGAALAFSPALGQGAESAWAQFSGPSEHDPRAVGTYTNGCLLGGSEVPAEGTGYQVVRLSRKRNFGHPLLVAYLSDLGSRVAQAKLGTMLVADVAMPRGGPFTRGHRSHQTGLDADIWLRLDVPELPRDQRNGDADVQAVSVVNETSFTVSPQYWTPAHGHLLRLAASDDRVARIFVHPVIKKALCEKDWADRSWLRRIRPWHGHTAHFHVRLQCPAGDAACLPQAPPPEGDGCGEELTSWLPPNYRKPAPSPPREPPVLPGPCQALLDSPDTSRTW